MGLLTGFSILSGVEIIFYFLRFLCFALKIFKDNFPSGSSCLSRSRELWLCPMSTNDLKTIRQGQINIDVHIALIYFVLGGTILANIYISVFYTYDVILYSESVVDQDNQSI